MLALALLFAAAAPSTEGAPLVPYDIKTDDDVVKALHEHYTKHEADVPMRDGVKLHLDYWTPKDTSRAWPILMTRTPYSIQPYGVENFPDAKSHRQIVRFAPSKDLIKSGYVFVHEDVRGRLMSEGTFVEVRPMTTSARRKAHDAHAIDEATDAYDTIDWLVKNVPHNNGRVGIWGISYPGFYAAQAAVDAHPALKAVAPMAPVTDWFVGDDFHHNGAFFLADSFDFEANFGRAREKERPTRVMKWDFQAENAPADAYDFFLAMGPLKNADAEYLDGKIAFWDEMMAHPNRDAWWMARNPLPQYRDIKPGVLVVGGWFDAEDLWGALHTYGAMNAQTAANNDVHIVMGPWSHGGWHRSDGDVLGDIPFWQKASERYRVDVETPFFESRLKEAAPNKTPEAFMFVTGVDEWRAFDSWPPKESIATPLYLAPNYTLGSAKPTADGKDSFVADPKKPVPYMAGAGPFDHDYMTADQRFAAHRPDVLAYETAPLTNEVTIAGPIEASVWLETTGSDADVVVKVVDVWPEDTADPEPNPKRVRMGGYQQLVRGEVMRARFRDGFDKPRAFTPGKPELVKVTLPDVAHTFRAGHRIAIQIQSSWFPLVDSNPQTFVANIADATDADFKAATHTVHRGGAMASSVALPVLSGSLPR